MRPPKPYKTELEKAEQRLAARNGKPLAGGRYPPGEYDDSPPAAVQEDRPQFGWRDGHDIDQADYKRAWLVKDVLVRNQPAIVGGPKKALKTSVAVDLAVSLNFRVPFLGRFEVPRQFNVALMSGESGDATVQETFRRVCAAKNVDLSEWTGLYSNRLPDLANPAHLDALGEDLLSMSTDVLIIDPLYLCLLAGVGAEGLSAANLYQTGPLLATVARTCLDVGVTPVLLHHFKITRANAYAEPELDDLAYSGVQEFARQWLLLGRREKYEPGTGHHRLWLSVGGSAGHTGAWAVDINEGRLAEDFTGRTWGVTVEPAGSVRTEARSRADREKADKRQRQDRDDEALLMGKLDRLDPHRAGAGYERLRNVTGLSDRRMAAAVDRLRAEGLVEFCECVVTIGSKATRPAKGIRRPRGDQ
jgi:hypothetical protein